MNRILLAAALALGLSSGAAEAASGTLMIYTSTPDKAMNDLIANFNKVEPDVKVQFFRSGTTEVVNKLQAEFTAGAPQPDVLFIADATVMEQMKADDRLMAYTDAPVAGLPSSFYDSDKTYRGRQFGYPVMWRALRPGGLFISDDIQDNLAFAHFVERARASYGVVESAGKYVGIALKPGLKPAVN